MAIIHDFSKIKEQIENENKTEFEFGEELMLANNSFWKAMAITELPDKNTLLIYKFGYFEGKRFGSFLLHRCDAMVKTGKVITTKERFLDWLESEQKNYHPEEE